MAEPKSCASGLDLHHPGGLSSLVGQQAKIGHKARDGAHDVHDARIAVAPGAKDGVGVDHSRGLRPAQNLAFFGLVAHLVQIAGAGKGILIHQSQFLQLALVERLLGIHKLIKNQLHDWVRWHIRIQWPGVHGEWLLGYGACLNKFLHQIIDRSDHLQAKRCDQMIVFGRHRDHFLRTEGVAVHDQGLHDLGHDLPLGPVENFLLFQRYVHRFFLLTVSSPHPRPARSRSADCRPCWRRPPNERAGTVRPEAQACSPWTK